MYFGVANCTNIFMNNPGFCRPCGFGSFRAFSPGCFGYGFCGMSNPMAVGAGIGLGYAAGATLLPLVPAIFKGIGKGCSWLWNKAIVPAGKWIGNGIKNLWNKIFHKESKTEKANNQK